MKISTQLVLAITRNELQLAYQPIVEAQTGRLIAAEALLRWSNKELGNVRPDEFIPVAEETGLIKEIGAWVVRQACRDAMKINAKSASPVTISVNVSTQQIANDEIVKVVDEALRSVGLAPNLLKLEITETAFASNVPVFGQTVDQLRALGVSIALDDFGTGYSSLSYLHQFSFNQLKIDKSFIDRIPASEDGVLLVKGIVQMAHSLRLEVVAEGVETIEQMRLLAEIGCDKIQGYHISRPVFLDDFMGKLTQS